VCASSLNFAKVCSLQCVAFHVLAFRKTSKSWVGGIFAACSENKTKYHFRAHKCRVRYQCAVRRRRRPCGTGGVCIALYSSHSSLQTWVENYACCYCNNKISPTVLLCTFFLPSSYRRYYYYNIPTRTTPIDCCRRRRFCRRGSFAPSPPAITFLS